MAQATLVGMQLKDGQSLIERLVREGIAVTAAAWVKESESGDWYLYLATPLVGEDEATLPAYRRLNTVFRVMQQEGFGMEPFQVKVIGPHDPIAKDISTNCAGHPGRPPTPFRGSRLGELAVEEAYVYPRPPTFEEAVGMQLWEGGRTELRPGIRQAGLCRVVVIDLENQAVLQDRTYRDTMANPQSLLPGQVEVTWAEGGAVRLIGADTASGAFQRWGWSQPRLKWEEGGCPPNKVLHGILAAVA